MVPAGITNAVAVAAGGGDYGGHSLILPANGSVVAFGRNHAGQTNVPAGLSNVVAISAGYAHNLAISAPLRIHGFTVSNKVASLEFQTFTERNYGVQYATNLVGNTWWDLPGNPVAGTVGGVFVADPAPASTARRFYRLIEE